MDDSEDIVQEPSPLEYPVVKVNRDVFYNKEFYKRIKEWCRARHPKVFVVDHKNDEFFDGSNWGLMTYHVTFHFTSTELYLQFIKEFPEVLRGADES